VPPAPKADSGQLPLVAMLLGIFGFIFSFGSGWFLKMLTIFTVIPAIILGFMLWKKGKKAMTITAIVLGILGLLLLVMGNSKNKNEDGSSNNPKKTETVAMKNFSDPDLGYSIDYPKDWKVSQEDSSVTLTAPKDVSDFPKSIFIQNILTGSRGGKSTSLDGVIKDFKKQVKDMDKNAKITDAGNFTVKAASGKDLQGKGFEAAYKIGNTDVKNAVSIIDYPEGGVYFYFGYIAQKDEYEKGQDTLLQIMKSWKIDWKAK
jgi:hypothetical protein